uniref:X8 domain-containing protein n=1 Tax=Oryza nivara TaxID=4536 RepID=A0A0E0I2R9_ORYNI
MAHRSTVPESGAGSSQRSSLQSEVRASFLAVCIWKGEVEVEERSLLRGQDQLRLSASEKVRKVSLDNKKSDARAPKYVASEPKRRGDSVNAHGAFVGINVGTDISNPPSASDIVSILKEKKIQHVRLLDSDHQMLSALANTGIEVVVGVPNDQLLRVGQSRSTAADWINKNVAAYIPATNITHIAVGNEVLTTEPNAALVLVPALQFLHAFGCKSQYPASGWPSHGGQNEKAANVDNALAYNTNLIRHVLNNSGTPGQPNNQVSTFIFELFNEDLRAGPVSEKNWGIMFPNATTVYSLTFEDMATTNTDSPVLRGTFCVANSSAPHSALKQSLDWACGPGSANCSAIQPGQPCYKSDDIVAVASYAFNDYYHRTRASGGTCNFNSTAMVTSTDPSHGSCIFAGSTGSNGSSGGAASGPVSPDNFATQIHSCWLTHLITLLSIMVFM